MNINPHKSGLSLGFVLGGVHLLWTVLVAMEIAQPLVDFVFRLHFIKPPFVITQFSLGSAALLVLLTAACGYAIGFFLATAWNLVHGEGK